MSGLKNAPSHDAVRTPEVLWAEFAAIHPGETALRLSGQDVRDVLRDLGPAPAAACREERRRRARDALSLAAYYKTVHALPQGQSALCLSGGGIRSAAFALGVLQAFARRDMLSQFNYLSTVSGGGYIGCWLTGLAHRCACAGGDAEGSFKGVERVVAGRAPHAPSESEPFSWLRKNQKFLSPHLGMLSADIWAAGALFLRNLVLNWLVYIPAIAAVLLLPRLMELSITWWVIHARDAGSIFGWGINAWVLNHLQFVWQHDAVHAAIPGWKGWTDLMGALLVLLAMARSMFHRTSEGGTSIDDRDFRRSVLLPLMLGGVLLVMFNAVLLVQGAVPDLALLVQWLIGVPITYVAARVAAWAWRLLRGRSGRLFGIELLFLTVSGAVVGLVVWAGLLLRNRPGADHDTVRDMVVFGVPWMLLAFVAGQTAYAGLASQRAFGRRDQEWFGRASGQYLLAAAVWGAAGVLTLYGGPLNQQVWGALAVTGAAGTLTLAAAVSTISKATTALAAARERVSVSLLVKAGALLFLFSGSVALSSAVNLLIAEVSSVQLATVSDALVATFRDASRYDPLPMPTKTPGFDAMQAEAAAAWRITAEWIVGLGLIAVLASLVVDVNQFSLHALYRNRLVRTFLGASNIESVNGHPPARSRFDGFSETDDIRMAELWRSPAAAGATVPAIRPTGPFPVISMALNLVGTRDPAWQERKAGPFAATPLHLGSDLVGYRPQETGPEALTLGTAMAISGAAASPNWGYHSSPLVGFVMMLFNVRLGWWLKNPDPKRRSRWPRNLALFGQEAIGRTTADASHLYLSDGGHFDNLGLYEMLRRRCRLIVVVDATQDTKSTLDDLGRTLRTAAVDLGVVVSLSPAGLNKRTDPATSGVYAAMGEISYPEQTGPDHRKAILIYIKPGFFVDAPVDVRAYAAANALFPHDPTSNQFFTESQFESYRVLGSHAASRLLQAAGPGTRLSELPRLVRAYLRPPKPA